MLSRHAGQALGPDPPASDWNRKADAVQTELGDPLRLWGACPANMQSRPFWGVWIAISQGVGQDARRVIQTFA